jgi:hypothetical protein
VDDIGKILPSLFKKEIRRDEPHLLEILQPLWPRITGKPMAQHSQPVSFAAGVLTVTTDCPTWNAQMRHMTEDIRCGINGFLGQSIVKKLRIKKVNQAGLFSAPGMNRESASPEFKVSNPPMDTTSITDPEIASALADSYAKYFSTPRRNY